MHISTYHICTIYKYALCLRNCDGYFLFVPLDPSLPLSHQPSALKNDRGSLNPQASGLVKPKARHHLWITLYSSLSLLACITNLTERTVSFTVWGQIQSGMSPQSQAQSCVLYALQLSVCYIYLMCLFNESLNSPHSEPDIALIYCKYQQSS